jgi:SAM-dependent methyltransferase
MADRVPRLHAVVGDRLRLRIGEPLPSEPDETLRRVREAGVEWMLVYLNRTLPRLPWLERMVQEHGAVGLVIAGLDAVPAPHAVVSSPMRLRAQAARAARRYARRSGWLRLPASERDDSVAKPSAYLPLYERLLAPLRYRRCHILELGIWGGDSLAMWRDCLPRATIVGLDLAPIELHLGPRVHIVAGDQADHEVLDRMGQQHAPGGFDVIIDDASHMGIATARSLQCLFPRHLCPGGIYVIEDWATGYLAEWKDGGTLDQVVSAAGLDASPSAAHDGAPVHLPSHDVGMVGLVKRLVDHVAGVATLPHVDPEHVSDPLEIAAMEIHGGLVVLRKRAG